VAYPVNVWMVSKNMKHGLMTKAPGATQVAPMQHDRSLAEPAPSPDHHTQHAVTAGHGGPS